MSQPGILPVGEVLEPSFEMASCPIFDTKTGEKLADWDPGKKEWVFNPILSELRLRSLKKELKVGIWRYLK